MPITATTDLPDVGQPTLDNGIEDEITASWSDAINYGSYRVEYRETSASSWIDDGAVGQDTLSKTIANLEDGEAYEVRIRSETEHVDGNWTTPVAIVTAFPTPTNLQVTSVSDTAVDLGWDDLADNEDGFQVERKAELDNRRDTGFEASWTEIANLPPNTETYSDTTVQDNWTYQYRVIAYTEDASSTSGTVVATTKVAYDGTFQLELRRPDGEVLVAQDTKIKDVRLPGEHSAIRKWEVDIPYSSKAENWTRSEAFIWYDDGSELLMRGEFKKATSKNNRGVTTLKGVDFVGELQHGGAIKTYSSIPAHQAADDYITNETPLSANVLTPNPTIIATGKTVQQGSTTVDLQSFFSPAADEPFEVENGQLKSLPVCDVRDALDDNDLQVGVGADNDGRWNDGQAAYFGASGHRVEFDITFQHDIPADEVGIRVRDATGSGGANIEYQWDGSVIDTNSLGVGAGLDSTSWSKLGQQSQYGTEGGYITVIGQDIKAGETHQLRIEATGSSDYAADAIAVCDLRYLSDGDFPDPSAGNNGKILTGPPEFAPATITSQPHDSPYNITAATLTTSIDDTSGAQALQLSNDGGTTHYPQNGSEQNTQSVSADFDGQGSYGTTVRANVTLDGHGTNGTSIPAENYQGQALSSWDLSIDTNTLAVIDEKELVGSHFENAQELIAKQGLIWIAEYSETQKQLTVCSPGQLTAQADWTTLDHERTVDVSDYANSVTVYGGVVDGSRLVVTAKSESEINRLETEEGFVDGEVEAPPVFQENETNEATLKNIARTELETRLAEDGLTGVVDTPPKASLVPGKAYTVPELDGETLVLQSVDFSTRSGRLDFRTDNNLAAALSSIRASVRQTKNAF